MEESRKQLIKEEGNSLTSLFFQLKQIIRSPHHAKQTSKAQAIIFKK